MNLSMQEVQGATCDPRELYQQLYARTVISYGRELSTRRGQFLGKNFQIESGQKLGIDTRFAAVAEPPSAARLNGD